MKWTTKARLYLVGILGFTSCVSSVIRIIYQHRIGPDPLCIAPLESNDHEALANGFLGNFTGLLTWTLIDLTTAVMVASSPVISTLLPKAFGYAKSRGSSRTSSNYSGFPKALRPRRRKTNINQNDDSLQLSDTSTKVNDDKSLSQPTVRHKVEYETDLEYAEDYNRDVSHDGSRVTPESRHEELQYGQAL